MSVGVMGTRSELRGLYIAGGVAALLQLVTILAMVVVAAALGPRPTTAFEYFELQQSSRVESVLRGDLLTLVLIGLYLGTFPALYVALRRVSPVYVPLAALFTFMTVTLAFGSESTFSLLRLGDQYAAAGSDALRAQLLAAGEAVIAGSMWNGTAAYASGILLQGAGVLVSAIMLRSRDFGKITAWAGLIGNALDLLQHLLHPFVPAVSDVIVPLMGLPYVVWFVMLSRDLIRLGVRRSEVPECTRCF